MLVYLLILLLLLSLLLLSLLLKEDNPGCGKEFSFQRLGLHLVLKPISPLRISWALAALRAHAHRVCIGEVEVLLAFKHYLFKGTV